MTHIPALDGLRGLAVLAILLFHDERLPGGWLGVDVFFVLSGFLITSLLLGEHAVTGHVSLLSFWGRRARRLLPALFALLFGVCAYAGLLAQPEELLRIRADAIATLLYVANWQAIAAGHDYWEIFRLPSPLDHTWSLAIEEQFYLLWPPVVLWVLGRSGGSARALQRTAWGLALGSALWMAWLFDPSAGTARVYFGTDTRWAATLVGAALAAALRPRVEAWPDASNRRADAAAVASLLVLLFASFVLSGSSPVVYRGGLFALILAVAVVTPGLVLCPAGFCARVLSAAPLRALGILSYGVYLWHWPIYLVLTSVRTGLESWAVSGLRVGATLLVSWLSYTALERPIRRGVLPASSLLRIAAATTAVLLACIWGVTQPPGGEARSAGGDASVGHPDVLLIGDSLAESLLREFPEEANERGYHAQVLAAPGCGALRSDSLRDPSGRVRSLRACTSLRKRWLARVAEASPQVVILLEGWPGERERSIGEEWAHACEPLFDRAHARGLSSLAEATSAAGTRLAVVLAPPPSVADLRPSFIANTELDGLEALEALLVERVGCLNRVRREVAAEAKLRAIDLEAEICPAGVCRERDGGLPLRPDGLHFRGSSAIWLSGWLLEQIEDESFESANASRRGP